MESRKPLDKVLNFISFSNGWIAIAALLQTVLTYLLSKEIISYSVLGFVFSSTLFTYNFLRILKLKSILPELYSEQMKWVSKSLKWITLLLIFSILGVMVLFFYLSLHQQLILMISGIIVIGYNLPLTGSKVTLRKIPFLKSFLIAGVWTFVTYLLPLSHSQFSFPADEFLMRFLFVFAISIPFDIRDLKYDDPKMKTIPQVFGKTGGVLFGIILLGGSSLLTYYIYPNYFIPLLLSNLVTSVILLFSIKEKDDLFYSIMVDGMLILQVILILIWDVN